ncbi:Aminopeptidase CC_2544 [hydrothermal vent metagenome]|uniref:Carboxypeptidase Q n=1 Tax=hydrothermal vent metagenome TaxID=652676 RepID=A0A3B0V7U7_9ZZZZ
MLKTILMLLCFIVAIPATNAELSVDFLQQVATLRDKALNDDTAYKITESLTTEVGARFGGSVNDAKAVAWAVAKFNQLGFDKVYTQPVTFPKWVRGVETAAVISPYPHELKITALGGSYPTPKNGLQGEIIHFKTIEDLEAADAALIKGKITFISNRMERTKTGKGYGVANAGRYKSAYITAQKGGIGAIIRSIGTDNHRNPHTGGMKTVEKNTETGKFRLLKANELVPAAAISNPDADLLVNILKRNKPVIIKYTLGSYWDGEYTSQNVIGEITGRTKPDEVVVIGGHLDSWDLGTGAVDDASGCAITMAAAKLIKDAGMQPYRTIRVVLWANEELGLHGARAYAKAHINVMNQHIIGAESDFGAAPVYAFGSRVSAESLPVVAQMAELLQPLGIEYINNNGRSGADISPLKKLGMATMGLYQDGTNYFDLHHTADDTLDKIVPAEIAQNVAAWVVFVAIAAEYTGNFGFDLE